MQHIKLDEFDTRVYGLDVKSVELYQSNANLLACRLLPGKESESHNHFENEMFIFTQGRGTVTNGSHEVTVESGDAVLFSGFEQHTIINKSADETLKFLSVYWSSDDAVVQNPQIDKNVLLFATAPTPNGDLHLGHLSGPYLVADTLKRKLINAGCNVRYVSGFDHYQNYVLSLASKLSTEPREVCQQFSRRIQDVWAMANMMPDTLISPIEDAGYNDFVLAGVGTLYENGYIYSAETDAPFDRQGRYLHEALISGLCPHCNAPSDGNACEQCGRPNSCVDLVNPIANTDGHTPEIRKTERLYFKLSHFSDQLRQYIKSANMPSKCLSLSLQMIDDGLPDICISHLSSWGIKHKIKGFDDQVIYVWFEMAFGYLWGARGKNSEDTGKSVDSVKQIYSEQDHVIHCYGFDNTYYHTLLFPAVYIALDIRPPNTHIVNELLYLDGQKFSTSRKHAIWGIDLLKDLHPDYFRFVLSYFRPENENTNFNIAAANDLIIELFQESLLEWLSNVNECQSMMNTTTVPEPGAWLADHVKFFERLRTHQNAIIKANQTEIFSPFDLSHTIELIIREGVSFTKVQKVLFVSKNESQTNYQRTAMALCFAGLNLMAQAMKPVMPDISKVIAQSLNAIDTHQSSDLFSLTGVETHQFGGNLLPPVTTLTVSQV